MKYQKGSGQVLIIIVLVLIVGIIGTYYLYENKQAKFSCPEGSKIGIITGPLGAPMTGKETCYKVSGFEGKQCSGKSDCGSGSCIGKYRSDSSLGICTDYTSSGCYKIIYENAKSLDLCVD